MIRVERVFCALLILSALSPVRGSAEVLTKNDRLGWSADGNLADPDDWGATAIALAIFAKQGWQDKLVHLDYNNRLDRNNDEKAREQTISVLEGVKNFNFTETKVFDCQTDLEAAIESAVAEINKSSASSRFWYVQAGPFEVAYQALQRAEPEKRQYCILVSHSEMNERSNKWKGARGKAECVSLGAKYFFTENQGKQKFGSANFREWHLVDWLKDSPCPEYRWVHSRLKKTAEYKDGVLDASDGGMAYVLATGDKDGNFSPKLRDFLGSAWKGSTRPNIVLIYADDLGYADLSCYGNEYHETPNIDRLMKEGIRFTQAYADAPLCTPSRIALLTGRNCARAGCYDVLPGRIIFGVKRDAVDFDPPMNNWNLPKDQRILPEFLKDIGYRTGAFGKWHVGRVQPDMRGFDEFVNLRTKSHLDALKSFVGRSPNYPEPEGYSSDYLADCAVQFINRNKDESFFLYLPHTLVHTVKSEGKGTLEPKLELLHKYQAKAKSELHGNAAYAAMVEALDQAVGQTVEALRSGGILDNTIVIFTSDNGAALGARRVTKSGVTVGENTSNYPLQGSKLQLYEGGIRVPTSFSYGDIARAGAVSDAVISQLDLLPTILELTKHPQAAEVSKSLDGRSLVPLLDDGESDWPDRDLYWHYPGYRISNAKTMTGTRPESALRSGNRKMIESLETGDVQLFDLATDIGELNDVSAAHPEVVNELRLRLKQWRESTNAPMLQRKDDVSEQSSESQSLKKARGR